jgi:mRNA-degrading endonuclease toxin of MazEF toxin-antitoxin module
MRQGEIYVADIHSAGPRPVIIVSRDELNYGTMVVVVPVTTAKLASRVDLANCVPFAAGDFGLTKDCVAQTESISVISTADFITPKPIGILDDEKMREVIRAIGYSIAAECEPA